MAMYKLPLALVLVASLVGEAAAFHTAAAMRPGSLAAHRSSAPAMATYQFVPQLAPLFQPAGGPSLLTAASIARAGPISAVLVAVLSAPLLRIAITAVGVWLVALKRAFLKKSCDESDACTAIYGRIESVLPLRVPGLQSQSRPAEQDA